MKNTITWPRMSLSSLANVTNVRFTALSMSSTHMNITSTLRRDEQADRADGEEHRGERPGSRSAVIVEREGTAVAGSSTGDAPRSRRSSSSCVGWQAAPRASTTAPTTAITSSAAVISNGQRKSVNRTAATRSTLPPSPAAPPRMASSAGGLAPVAHL